LAKKRSKREAAELPSFEESLDQLKETVHQLEEGEIGLNESLKQYEKGVALLRRCYELLDAVERRIELLSGVDAEGRPISVPMAEQPPSGGVNSADPGDSGGGYGDTSAGGEAASKRTGMDASEGVP